MGANADHSCFVYAARRDDGLVKIGHTKSLERRLPFLRCRGHKGARYIYSAPFRSEEAPGIERLAHRIAADRHVENEVFRLTDAEAAELITNAAGRYAAGERAKMLPKLPDGLRGGRPSMKVKATVVRLPLGVPEMIDALVGNYRRSEFIRQAVCNEIARRTGLTNGCLPGDIASSTKPPRRVDGVSGRSQRRQ